MFTSLSKLLNQTLNALTFRQRFLLFAAIFGLFFPFPFYWFIIAQNYTIDSAKNQMANFENQKRWVALLNDILFYELNFETSKDSTEFEDPTKKVLFDFSVLNGYSEDNLLKGELLKIWEQIASKTALPPQAAFELKKRLTLKILEKLKTITLRDEQSPVNIVPINPTINFILFKLYRMQLYTVEAFSWNLFIQHESQNRSKYEPFFFTSLLQFKETLTDIQNILGNNLKIQSITNDPLFLLYLEKNQIFFYFKNLNNWIESHNSQIPNLSAKTIENLLEQNKKIAEALINYAILYNKNIKESHEWYRDFCIAVIFITLFIILFYVFFHVLTNHFLELDNYIQALARGIFKPCFCSGAGDEFGPVGKAFDKMAKTIQQMVKESQRLGRLLTESVKHIVYSSVQQKETFSNDERKIKELEDYTKVIADRTQFLAKIMNDISISSHNELPEKAKKTLEKMETMISSLTLRSSSILQHLTNLKIKLDRCKKLFSFLIKVSHQASLLSLNSAIVSSTMMSNKQSFVKITDEIKRFSDKTSASTSDMLNIVKGVFVSIDHIYDNTNKFLNELNQSTEKLKIIEKQLGHLTHQIENQAEKFQTVNKIMQDQAHISDEIKKSLDDLAHVANENNSQTVQLDKTIDELSGTAENLQNVLNQFFHPKKLKNNE